MPRVFRAIGLGLFFALVPTPLGAQPVEVPPTWGGDFWSRPRLTGGWWGLRDELDTDLLLTPQGVLSGGRDTDAEFWGGKGLVPVRPHDTFGVGLRAHRAQRQLPAHRAPRPTRAATDG